MTNNEGSLAMYLLYVIAQTSAHLEPYNKASSVRANKLMSYALSVDFDVTQILNWPQQDNDYNDYKCSEIVYVA